MLANWRWLPGALLFLAALFLVDLFLIDPGYSAATVRHYYIAAEDVTWDYAPSGRDLIVSRPVPLPWLAHTRWAKTRYIEYTDASFSVRKPQPEWLGILGPVIRGEVGDEIVVIFLNRARVAHSMHPHGLRYDKNSEGATYIPAGAGSQVAPGSRFTYHWFADSGSGPGPGQLSSIVWWYHAHNDESRETNAGLQGPIVITAKGKANPDGSPKDVDREFVASFMVFDELAGKPEGLFHAINGLIFGNLSGLVMKQGEKVRWYVLGMGNERDMHSPHWHGKTLDDGMRHTDVVELLPGSMATLDMMADNPGVWLLHCHVSDHMESGMMATFTIYQPSARACPVKLTAGDFWKSPDKFSMAVENSSGKNIRSLSLTSEYFLSPQDLHRPFVDAEWKLTQPLAAGQQQTLEKKAYSADQIKKIVGWALFPSIITFEDGTVWKPQATGECFQVFWRDAEHPDLSVLPSLQVELNAD